MRLREIREARAHSLRSLSEKSGVAQDTISEVERGLRRPHATTIRKLAKALDVEVEDITGGVPTVPKVLAPPSLEWALAASDEEFDSRIRSTTSMDLHKLWISLTNYSQGLEVGKEYKHANDRAQVAVDQYFRLQGIHREKTIGRWPSKATENEGRETG